jgi:CheY-like chemotaxis protein
MDPKLILLVEDNPDHEALTIRALRKNHIGNEVVVARDGAEALELLFEKNILPQVVLLDLKLPKIDGLEVLKRMRADPRTHLLPVVVLTSSDEERDMLSSYQLGANSYVRKPENFIDFVEATRQLGMYWLVINQAPMESRNEGTATTAR